MEEVARAFSLELLQQFISFASSMAIVMQEDDTITKHAMAFAADGYSEVSSAGSMSPNETRFHSNVVQVMRAMKTRNSSMK
ncbi:hypothetical protein AVEN_219644-1 [Araneus ventricosus]|uniref:Uncharacterized protein n=1 Tax=Araneus ventricosus TaxID=182803 RepID=A0A4Y2KTX9_ARAVE|nr:hypothetical protein AVEN_219644-1 [Araneus ventricosus]